jgi:hypothetical protein
MRLGETLDKVITLQDIAEAVAVAVTAVLTCDLLCGKGAMSSSVLIVCYFGDRVWHDNYYYIPCWE